MKTLLISILYLWLMYGFTSPVSAQTNMTADNTTTMSMVNVSMNAMMNGTMMSTMAGASNSSGMMNSMMTPMPAAANSSAMMNSMMTPMPGAHNTSAMMNSMMTPMPGAPNSSAMMNSMMTPMMNTMPQNSSNAQMMSGAPSMRWTNVTGAASWPNATNTSPQNSTTNQTSASVTAMPARPGEFAKQVLATLTFANEIYSMEYQNRNSEKFVSFRNRLFLDMQKSLNMLMVRLIDIIIYDLRSGSVVANTSMVVATNTSVPDATLAQSVATAAGNTSFGTVTTSGVSVQAAPASGSTISTAISGWIIAVVVLCRMIFVMSPPSLL